MKAWVIKKFVLPVHQALVGERFRPRLEEALENQYKPPEELARLQLDRLGRLLRHAFESVPYYRDLFRDLGATPEDIRTRKDFEAIPPIGKAEINANAERLKARNYPKGNFVATATGGSTGEPLRFFWDRASFDYRRVGEYRFYSWVGMELGDPHVFIWGAPSDINKTKALYGRVRNYFLNKHWVDAFALREETIRAALALINRVRPVVVTGYANALYIVARFAKDNGIRVASPAGVVSCAELLFPHQRALLEEVFGCRVFNRYGCREVCDIGQDCRSSRELHLAIDNVVVEVTREGKSLPAGEPGEILITDLHNFAFPLIRYRIGDVGRMSDASCDCGLTLPKMQMVEGRVVNAISTPDGRALAGEFFPHLIKEYPGVRQYQILQPKLDELIVKIVPANGSAQGAGAELKQKIARAVGPQVRIELQYVSEIPLEPSGKHLFVKSAVPLKFDR